MNREYFQRYSLTRNLFSQNFFGIFHLNDRNHFINRREWTWLILLNRLHININYIREKTGNDVLQLHTFSSLLSLLQFIDVRQIHENECVINSLSPRRNRRHFADDSSNCIFVNGHVLISIEISLAFIPKGPINNIPALFQKMVCADQATSHFLTNEL